MLDEVSELPLEVQALFLRVLEDGTFRRLGGSREFETHARTIAVSNKPLNDLAQSGRFRQDLLFRLNTIEIVIPPLRQRCEDIRLLAQHFCQRMVRASGVETHLTPEAISALMAYPWPGNVRELRNVIERSVLLSKGEALTPELLELPNRAIREPITREASSQRDLPTLKEVERRHITAVMSSSGGNRTHAAAILGISRSTLARKLDM